MFWQICKVEVEYFMSKFRLPEKCLVELVKFNAENGYLPLVQFTCCLQK